MVEVEVLIRSVEAARLSEDAKDSSEVAFEVTASLNESDRSAGQLTMRFSIDIQTTPQVAKIDISGVAKVTGDEQEIERLLTGKEAGSTPPVFMSIYKKVYAMLYLIAGSLRIPYPSPGLLKVVKVATSREVAATAENERIRR
ncbi:MAG: hypothetical protein E6K96_03830 [Thaumarchaeota archaeon]|nr:MAG: hypothetical protein E6K96_03830 [Nitrososphaerota archaeon]